MRKQETVKLEVIESLGLACTVPTDRRVAAVAAIPLNYKMILSRLEATNALLDVSNHKYGEEYDR